MKIVLTLQDDEGHALLPNMEFSVLDEFTYTLQYPIVVVENDEQRIIFNGFILRPLVTKRAVRRAVEQAVKASIP